MKQQLIDMMTAMMPFMRPVAVGAAGLALLGLSAGLFARKGSGIGRLFGMLVLLAGVFFVVCEAMGRWLGFEPTLLFADPLDRVLYRNQWPFWMVGIGLLVAGLIVRSVARGRGTAA